MVFSPEVKKESESAKCFIRNNEKEGINAIATIVLMEISIHLKLLEFDEYKTKELKLKSWNFENIMTKITIKASEINNSSELVQKFIIENEDSSENWVEIFLNN